MNVTRDCASADSALGEVRHRDCPDRGIVVPLDQTGSSFFRRTERKSRPLSTWVWLSQCAAELALINKDVAVNERAAGGVTVAKLDGEKVVSTRETVVGYIENKSSLLFSDADCSGHVGMVTSDNQSGNVGCSKRDLGSWIAISEVTADHRFFLPGLELRIQLESGQTAVGSNDRSISIDIVLGSRSW